jgi:hypothetical protein
MKLRELLYDYLRYPSGSDKFIAANININLHYSMIRQITRSRLGLKDNLLIEELENYTDQEINKHIDYFIENHLDFETYIKVMQEENEDKTSNL